MTISSFYATEQLLEGNYEVAKQYLSKETQPLELAYAFFLSGEMSSVLALIDNMDSIRSNWLRELVNLVVTSKMQFVTYFQIRNFLELDIDLLIKANRIDYLEILLAYASKLSDVNSETYKLIGRVLFNCKLYSLSKNYLDLYKDMIYYDPEVHFIYTKLFMLEKDYHKALTSINNCLAVLPAYYPALKLKKEVLALLDDNV